MPSLSGLDEDVFQAVTDLSDVSTLSRLSQISKVLRGLVLSRTLGLTCFLKDMHIASRSNRRVEGGSLRHYGLIRGCPSRRLSIFSDLPITRESRNLYHYETAWKTSIGCWELWVYLDKQDYFCVTAMKLQIGQGDVSKCARVCLLHFPRGAIVSRDELYRVLFSYNFNVIGAGNAPGTVFVIRPHDVGFFQELALKKVDIDFSGLEGKAGEVLEMHKWLRSPHMLRTDAFYSPSKIKLYAWKWVPDMSAYLVTFRYFSGVREHVNLVYAYIKCMEYTANIDFVWIFTTHKVPLNPVDAADVTDVWMKSESMGQTHTAPLVSITTRYNVGHYHNLVSLLFDFNWGMRETHDVTDRLDRSFNEDGALDPPPTSYDEDGWPVAPS